MLLNSRFSTWFADIVRRVSTSQTLAQGGVAILVGLGSGVGIWVFKWLIARVHQLLFGRVASLLLPLGAWTLILIPLSAGVVIGLIWQRFVGEEKVHGTAAIMQSVALSGGRLRYKLAPLKALGAALSIGAGASVGPEDPSVQIGANFGSMVGQFLRMSDDRIRTFVAAGAGAAIAAAFNAPIAGVFFALEIVLGEIGSQALGMILISTVVSSLFMQAVSGTQPAFSLPAYSIASIWELPLYLLLGLLAGPVSGVYVWLLYRCQDWYAKWKVPQWVRTGSAGLAVGVAGLFLPQIFGVGYETIEEILNKNDFTLWLLLALLVGKIVITSVNISGGFPGGVFAPALFIGATLGGAFGLGMQGLFPSLGINASAFALVGMAAVLAGSVHAPLTAVILLFEMTNDYRIILPLMFAVAVSLIISQRFQRDSVYAMGLARHGIRLDRGRDVEVLAAITVEEIMQKDVSVLYETDDLNKAAEIMAEKRRHGLPVLDDRKRLVGILTLQDLDKTPPTARRVGEACTRTLITAYPDETLADALRRMSQRDLGRMPVVSRQNPNILLGMIRRADVIRAYDIALTRRMMQRHREAGLRLDAVTPERVDVTEIAVQADSQVVGKKLKDITFPQESVIASVRRGSNVFIPHGRTVILPGDILIVVAQGEALDQVLEMCKKSERAVR
ncbi:MAG: chloride channel protein [Anaerolineales bacterium]